jgi:hypothetical protein
LIGRIVRRHREWQARQQVLDDRLHDVVPFRRQGISVAERVVRRLPMNAEYDPPHSL